MPKIASNSARRVCDMHVHRRLSPTSPGLFCMFVSALSTAVPSPRVNFAYSYLRTSKSLQSLRGWARRLSSCGRTIVPGTHVLRCRPGSTLVDDWHFGDCCSYEQLVAALVFAIDCTRVRMKYILCRSYRPAGMYSTSKLVRVRTSPPGTSHFSFSNPQLAGLKSFQPSGTLGTGEDSVISAPGTLGSGGTQPLQPSSTLGSGEDSVTSAPGTLGTGEDSSHFSSRHPWDWRN